MIVVKLWVFEGSFLSTKSVIKKKANVIEQAIPTVILMAAVTSERISGVPVKLRLESINPKNTMAIIARKTSENRIVKYRSSLYKDFEVFPKPAKMVAPTIEDASIATVIEFVIN